jgi:ribosomal protein S18 acetylase RimI-like enzyme
MASDILQIQFRWGSIEWARIDNRRAYIRSIFVDENYRRQGFGTRMMYEFCMKLFMQRIWNVELDSVLKPDNDFYEKLGFVYFDPHGDNAMHAKTINVLRRAAKLKKIKKKL